MASSTTTNTMTHPALRLTPSNSPFFKNNNSPRSPTRKPQEEPGLQLRKVIGTTTSSCNGFDASPSAKCFAYTAGAAAVVATVNEDDLTVRQRFFRARPAATGTADFPSTWAASPSPLQPKHRALGAVRESNGSPFSSSVNNRDWSDSPSGKSTTAKDRVKAVTSVALSPNGKWLAVGETGYKPRILIFSLAEDSSDAPVTTLSEHSYGVHCLRFSPDSMYLASLGTMNDGFLFVWSVNDRTGAAELSASNKLTTLSNCMIWIGKSLLTVGLRFVKVWRPEEHNYEVRTSDSTPNLLTPRHRESSRLSDFGRSIFTPKHKTLHGKNSLLNELLDCNFVAALALSSSQAVICADSGEICLLDDSGRTQNISLLGVVDFTVTVARIRTDQVEILGPAGQSKILPLSDPTTAFDAPSRARRETATPIRSLGPASDAIVATAQLDGLLIELTANRVVTIQSLRGDDIPSVIQLPAHSSPIHGIRTLQAEARPTSRILTYSGNGTIHLWSAAGDLMITLTVPISSSEQLPNELKVVEPTSDGKYLVVGDKHGVLMLVDIDTGICIRQLRAHSAEICDLSMAVIANTELVATAGRDRVVQLFVRRHTEFELLQTLDEHAGAVGGVLLDASGQRLISFSTDRTIVIREALFQEDHPSRSVLFTIDRTIVLRSSPCAITLSTDDHLLVSAVDRSISRYNLQNGQCVQSFKCADNEGGESVVVSKLLHIPSLYGIPCIAGVCSADKSVRLYNEQGTLLARDWGHTEGITDLVVFPTDDSETSLVTVAADSTMFIWNIRSDKSFRASLTDGEAEDASAEARLGPPLRKVISQTELSRMSRKKSTTDESKSSSPTNISVHVQSTSPRRLRKKTSRSSVSQPPRLEPSAQFQRRTSVQRSPSPPSPRALNKKRESMRRRSLATLRSKSSNDVIQNAPPLPHTGIGFGSLASSSESLCRTLRAYRKKIAGNDTLPQKTLKELDHELRSTMLSISKHLHVKEMDDASSSTLQDETSQSSVGSVHRRGERPVDDTLRQGSDGFQSMASSIHLPPRHDSVRSTESDTVSMAGAMETMSIGQQR